MFTEFLDKLAQFGPLSEASREQLQACTSVKMIPKGDFVLEQGEVCKHLYYVNKGIVRIFYYKNGKEITEWFADEKQFCFSIHSYFNQTPSNLIIETIEESEVFFLSKEQQYQLHKTNLEIANMMISALSYALIMSQERMEALQFQTARQRYNSLLKEHPEILQKVPLHYLASYLGITQETLSRIRAK